MHPTPRHRMTGVRESRDGIEEEAATADIDMQYVAQDKATRNTRSPNAMCQDRDNMSPMREGITTARTPHRPW